MKLFFYGAAGGEVTGSNNLLEISEQKILIDCGMFQGGHLADPRNFERFAYDPKEVIAVFVTHAHIDHIGRIPKLIKDGFVGKIYSTAPTKDLAGPLLSDSAHILGEESQKYGTPILYGEAEIEHALTMWQTVDYHEPVKVAGITVTFYDAGHILGSSFITIEAEGKRVVFSGDLGNSPSLLVRPTEFLDQADYCVIESTYGSRIHEEAGKRLEVLKSAIKETATHKGVLMIPAFAMERTQDLLFELNELVEGHLIPAVPIYVDSPLGIKITEIYKEYPALFNDTVKKIMAKGDDIFYFKGLHFTPSTEESKAINDTPSPKVIVASSGMSEGGRIIHHERRYLSDAKNTILFVGYQSPNSLGGRILSGEKEVKIRGEVITVRAKISSLGSFSAHADQPRLLNWLKPMARSLKKVFVVHGEPADRNALAKLIHHDLKLKTEVPEVGSTYDIMP